MKRERGSALLLAAVGFILMAGIGAALFSLSLAGSRATRSASNADAAYHMAEAGVDDAINKMRAWLADPDPSADYGAIGKVAKDVEGNAVNLVEAALSDGGYSVTIDPPFDGEGEYRIRSVGRVRGASRGIETWVVADAGESGGPAGLFSDQEMTLSGNVFTDSYNSALGTYASQATNTDPKSKKKYAGKKGSVGSNGNITVSGTVDVFGNATPGPKALVKTSGSVNISGSTAPASKPTALTPVTYAPSVATKGNLSMSGKTALSLGAGSHRYTTLSMSAQTKITFTGDVTLYVDKDISVSGQAQWVVAPGATVKVVHGSGSISLSGGGLVNSSQLPKNFKVESATTGGSISISGNSAFYGVVNAPGAELKPSGTTDLYGSFVARKITVSGGVVFHHDEDAGGSGSGELTLNVKSWNPFVP